MLSRVVTYFAFAHLDYSLPLGGLGRVWRVAPSEEIRAASMAARRFDEVTLTFRIRIVAL